MAEGDFQNMSSQLQSIHRIPSLLRDLDPNAYEPQVVSIGPYHYGKPQLQAMEVFKKRAVDRFLDEGRAVDRFLREFRSAGRSLNDARAVDRFLHEDRARRSSICFILAEFKREPSFRDKVENCYGRRFSDIYDSQDSYIQNMVELILDGCFLLELLLDRAENHAHLSYVKMDMLVLDNQIPLFVLRKLASIIAYLASNRRSASQPTGSENVTIQIENENIEENITKLIWKFYRTSENDEIPADLPDDAHHVLDAYWRKFCIGTGAYDGWASSLSVRELYYHGVKFQPSGRSVRDVEFNVSENYFRRLMGRFINRQNNQNGQEQQNRQNNESEQAQQNPQNNQNGQEHQNPQNNQNGQAQSRMIRTVWRFIPFGVDKGMFSVPRLTIDGTTRLTLRNLMAYERLHLYSETHPVTNYVLLMGSLIRSQNDVEHLRKESILWCSPGWTNESVVQLFADLTRNVVFNGTRTTNPEIDALCERPPNKFWSVWRRLISPESSDAKSLVVALLTLYGLVITALSTCFTIVKYFKQ